MFKAVDPVRLIATIGSTKEGTELSSCGVDQPNMPKNNIIVLTSSPSAANNARRLEKQLINRPEDGGGPPPIG